MGGGRARAAPPRWSRVAAAAVLVPALLIGGLWFFSRKDIREPAAPEVPPAVAGGGAAAAPSSYEAYVVRGSATLMTGDSKDGIALGSKEGRVSLPVGASLVTSEDGEVEVVAKDVGWLTLRGPSDVSLESVSADRHLLHLQRGHLSATVRAPPAVKPRLFQVGTPAGLAVDLGCKYDLVVDEAGNTTVDVTLGCVAFETERGQAWVPRGYGMTAPKGRSFGVPVDKTASPDFREAMRRHDAAADDGERAAALDAGLPVAGRHDLMTLWHLIARSPSSQRERVLVRMEAFLPRAADAERARILSLDPAALETLRRQFSAW